MDRNHPNHQHQPPDPQRDEDPRHTQDLDTVAQKPTHIGLGAAVTPPDKEAHRDCVRPTPGAQPPVEHPGAPACLDEPEYVAAGVNALVQSTTFTFRQMGPVRGLKTWLKVNKKDGFDCQSCAWPSPDDHRHVFEFCENGVKAFSSEATKKHITAEVFLEHPIANLLEKSDYWLEQQGRLVEPMVKRPSS